MATDGVSKRHPYSRLSSAQILILNRLKEDKTIKEIREELGYSERYFVELQTAIRQSYGLRGRKHIDWNEFAKGVSYDVIS